MLQLEIEHIRLNRRFFLLFIYATIIGVSLALAVHCINHKFDAESLPPIKNVIYTDQATRVVGDTLLLNTNK